MTNIELSKSDKSDKKYKVKIDTKTIHFGAKGMSDYTKHKDPKRKENYTARHAKRENWNKSGLDTAGFWSKNLLWNKPTITDSIKDIEKRFNVNIIKK
jgi:hypothetical protein